MKMARPSLGHDKSSTQRISLEFQTASNVFMCDTVHRAYLESVNHRFFSAQVHGPRIEGLEAGSRSP
jgi:hypothetical protein